MFPSFLPAAVNQLTEPASITLAENIRRKFIITPLSPKAIATSYVHQGSRETPILLLHGFDSSVLEFRFLIPLLAATRETWAVDLLGFGFTERFGDISYHPLAIKTHLYYFWKTLINQPIILVGTSMGGATAIDFTVTYPQAVKQLVLINSLGYSGDVSLGKFLFYPVDYLAVEYWRQRKIQALFFARSFGYLTPSSLDSLRCATLHLEMPNWHKAIISFMKSGGYHNLADKITQIEQPALILWGELDQTLGKDDASKFNNAIAHSQLIGLKNCGHVPHLEQPQLIVKHLLDLCR